MVFTQKDIRLNGLLNPFNAQEDTGVIFHLNSNSILRRDHKKISYERRAYESVDEKKLS